MDWCLLLTFIHTYLRNLLIVLLLYYRYTCDYLYCYTTIFVIMLPTTHRQPLSVSRCTEIRLIHHYYIHHHPLGTFFRRTISSRKWSSSDTYTKFSIFVPPASNPSKIIIGSTCLPPSNRKPKQRSILIPSFWHEKLLLYSLSISLLHFCQQPALLKRSILSHTYYEKENSWAFCFGTTCLFPITLLSTTFMMSVAISHSCTYKFLLLLLQIIFHKVVLKRSQKKVKLLRTLPSKMTRRTSYTSRY